MHESGSSDHATAPPELQHLGELRDFVEGAMAHEDLLKQRGGRIDVLREQESAFDSDARIDQAIAESFPASDPPSWNSGVDEPGTPEHSSRATAK